MSCSTVDEDEIHAGAKYSKSSYCTELRQSYWSVCTSQPGTPKYCSLKNTTYVKLWIYVRFK
eukprot:2666527-Amphidinium_carterae.1